MKNQSYSKINLITLSDKKRFSYLSCNLKCYLFEFLTERENLNMLQGKIHLNLDPIYSNRSGRINKVQSACIQTQQKRR